jgi:flagellar M-ring protein FliF
LASLPPAGSGSDIADAGTPVLTGEIEPAGAASVTGGEIASAYGNLPALHDPGNNPVDRLRAMIGERQEETVEILRSWLEESEEKVG